MIKFLVDEDLPRSITDELRKAGFKCFDVQDIGLRGSKDIIIFKWAQENGCIILSGDLGFSNIFRFPLGTHKGIVIARFPNELSTKKLNKILVDAIIGTREDLSGNLIIIEPDRIRIKRK
jgi:predicted nuclease of predicted toxin-antitoxin system